MPEDEHKRADLVCDEVLPIWAIVSPDGEKLEAAVFVAHRQDISNIRRARGCKCESRHGGGAASKHQERLAGKGGRVRVERPHFENFVARAGRKHAP